ncbi:MAG TPA: aquaporin [Nitrososphaeraceae archaeon]|nr:aquaporin [Nitrososphaeraceae archaeon]
MSQVLRLTSKFTTTQKKFFAELIGTFIVVVFAAGSVVLDAKLGGTLGTPFIAVAPFVGVTIAVYLFSKISMAHFNPAVTIGYLITKHIRKNLLVCYFSAEIIGALLAGVFVKYVIGTEANLGANAPNYNFSFPVIFGIEVLASALLMAVIYAVVLTKGLRGFSGVAIGGIVGLDIFFFASISGASMNPARSLAPALLSGFLGDLWLYLSATFVGTALVALMLRNSMNQKSNE